MPSRKEIESSGNGTTQGVPGVRTVVAILAGDIHMQANAPIARSAEPDWFMAMARPMDELRELATKHGAPVLYAGDIFDRWNASPEVINFAIKHLPPGYAIPGQHDLPLHNYEDVKRSAYWTLVEAGVLTDLKPTVMTECGDLCLYGYPWGYGVQPLSKPAADKIHIALIHKFIWTKGTGYPTAPASERLVAYRGRLTGYTVASFGDNHKGFIKQIKNGPTICNCGGFMRRKTDERNYRPGVGLVYSDDVVERHYLQTTDEHFIEATVAEQAIETVLDISQFVGGLRELGAGDALDFTAAMERFIRDNKIIGRVRDIIIDAIHG